MKTGVELTFEDALRIARGCTDYSGGHRSDPEHYKIYQEGIWTVIRTLESAKEKGLDDPQIKALHSLSESGSCRSGEPFPSPGNGELTRGRLDSGNQISRRKKNPCRSRD